MHNYKNIILFVFILLLTSGYSNSEVIHDSTNDVTVLDLTEDWLYFNEEYKSFFPYFKEDNGKVNSISRLIDLNKYQLYSLNFKASPKLSLFVDQKLIYTNNSTEFHNVRIRISDIVNNFSTEEEIITFYQANGILPLNDFYIGYDQTQKSVFSKAAPLILNRKVDSKRSIFLVAFIGIIFFVAVIKNRYPKRFWEFIGFDAIVPSIEDDVVRDITSIPVLIVVLINSLCMSLLLFLINDNFNIPVLEYLGVFNSNFATGILVIGTVFFFVLVIKFIYLKILGWIFNLSDLVKVQFFELMKVSLKINLLLVILGVIFYCSEYFNIKLQFNYLIYFVIATILLVVIRVGYLSFKLSGFRNIYLFSYLCTSEILPLAIIIKMILF